MGVPLLFFDILFNEFRKMKQMAYLLLWMIYNGFFYSLLRKFPVFKIEPESIHNNASPVISAGCGRPRILSIVGAMSASLLFPRSLHRFEKR